MQFLIDRVRQLVNISAQEELVLAELFEEKQLYKGEHFLIEGQVCKSLALIQQGLVRYYINNDGNEKTYFFGKEGDFVCDYESFLPQAPSNKNIQAIEDTAIYTIDQQGLRTIYEQIKEGERFGRLGIEQVFVSVLRQLSSFYKDPPEVRYDRFLEFFDDISQRIPQYYIASYVGIRAQSLSRIRNKKLIKKH